MKKLFSALNFTIKWAIQKLGNFGSWNEKIDDNSSVTNDVSNAPNIESFGDDYEK